MKQVIQDLRTGVLDVREVPTPQVRPRTLLVATACSLISSGTERATVRDANRTLLGKARARPELVRTVFDSVRKNGVLATLDKVAERLGEPKPLGYSAAGTVLEVGPEVEGFRPGDAVACAGTEFAHHAERIVVPVNLCARMPPGVPFEDACFTTVGAIALHGLRRSGVRLGESVAIVGMGLVGQLAARLARVAGARAIGIDRDPGREAAARAGGVVSFLLIGQHPVERVVRELTNGRGVDAVIVAASTRGPEPLELGAELCRDRGVLVAIGNVGMQIPREPFYRKELDLRLSRSYGPGRYDPAYEVEGLDYPYGYVRWTEGRNLECFLDLLAAGSVEVVSVRSHTFPVGRATEAYELLTDPRGGGSLGIVLTYPGSDVAAPVPMRIASERSVPHRCSPVPMAGTVGIGLIGAGHFARGTLLPLLRRMPAVRLRGVASARGVSAARTQARFGFAFASGDPQQVIEDEETHGVIIATRHDQHARLAVEALRRGRSVFVEKPPALSPEELKELLAAAANGPGLLVGYNRRFAPLVTEVKRHLDMESGPWMVDCRVSAGKLPADHWLLDARQGGGRILGELCHYVDLANHLVGAAPESVFARALGERGRVTEAQSVAATLSYPDGSICSLVYLDLGDARIAKERIEIFRGESAAFVDDFRSARLWRGGRSRKVGNRPRDKGHRAELEAFVGALKSGHAMPISLGQIEATSRVTFAVLDSLRKGEAVMISRSGGS